MALPAAKKDVRSKANEEYGDDRGLSMMHSMLSLKLKEWLAAFMLTHKV